MDNLLEIVKCSECKFILQSPVLLPCGNSVCQKHVVSSTSYYCQQCCNEHVVPSNGFPSNDAINFLIDINLAGFKLATKAFESYKSTIDKLESIKKDPKNEIRMKICELKSQVRSIHESLIKEIELRSEQITADLDKFEVECTKSLAELQSSMMENVDNRLEEAKLKLTSYLIDMKNLDMAFKDNWKSIFEKCELEKNKIVNFVGQVKKSLLLYRLDEFNQKLFEFSQLKLLNVAERPLFEQNLIVENIGTNSVYSSRIQECNHVVDSVNVTDQLNQLEAKFSDEDEDESDLEMIEVRDADESEERYFDDTEMNELRPFSNNKRECNFKDLSNRMSNALEKNHIDFAVNNKKTMSYDMPNKKKKVCYVEDEEVDENFDKNETKNQNQSIYEQTVKRLDENQVDKVFKNGIKFASKHFARRLLYKYFSDEERLVGTIRGTGPNFKKLDPIRIGFIRSHVTSRNGGHLSDEEWSECLKYMIKTQSSSTTCKKLKINLGITRVRNQ